MLVSSSAGLEVFGQFFPFSAMGTSSTQDVIFCIGRVIGAEKLQQVMKYTDIVQRVREKSAERASVQKVGVFRHQGC